MHAKARATRRAGPLACFLGDKILYADGLDARQIGDDADAVFCPVAIVKMPQFRAGILVAGNAERMAARGKRFAVLDGTSQARVRFVEVTAATAGARVAIPNECAAQAAIHATRRDDQRITWLSLWGFDWHGVYLVPGADAVE